MPSTSSLSPAPLAWVTLSRLLTSLRVGALAFARLIAEPEDGAPRAPRASLRDWKGSSGEYARELAVVFAAYLLGGKIGLMVPFTSGNVSAVWPAAGVAMAALLLVGYRVWPSIAAAALLVNFFTAIPALAALGMAAGDTAGPLVGVWLMRRTPSFNVSLACLTDVGTILVAAPLSAAVTRPSGSPSSSGQESIPGSPSPMPGGCGGLAIRWAC